MSELCVAAPAGLRTVGRLAGAVISRRRLGLETTLMRAAVTSQIAGSASNSAKVISARSGKPCVWTRMWLVPTTYCATGRIASSSFVLSKPAP